MKELGNNKVKFKNGIVALRLKSGKLKILPSKQWGGAGRKKNKNHLNKIRNQVGKGKKRKLIEQIIHKPFVSGSYGCVYKPPNITEEMKCGIEEDNIVSKILTTTNAELEIIEQTKVNDMDISGLWSVKLLNTCSILDRDSISKCNILNKFRTMGQYNTTSLVFEDAGVDLFSVITENIDINYISFIPLLEGLRSWDIENDFCHRDIKIENVMFNIKPDIPTRNINITLDNGDIIEKTIPLRSKYIDYGYGVNKSELINTFKVIILHKYFDVPITTPILDIKYVSKNLNGISNPLDYMFLIGLLYHNGINTIKYVIYKMINHNISTKEELSNRINYYKSLLLSLTTKKEGIQDIIIEFINNTINKYDIYGFGNVLLDISSYLYKQNKLIELSGKLVLLSRKCLIQDSILRINIEDLYNEFIKLVYNIDSDIVNIRFV